MREKAPSPKRAVWIKERARGFGKIGKGLRKTIRQGSCSRVIIAFRYDEATHEIVSPSVLPCLGTLAYYLRRVAAHLLMDAGMTCEAQTHQPLKSAVDSQSPHLVFGSCGLNGHHMMYTSGTCHDALLHTFFAKSVGAPELGNAQLVPLSAVVYLGFILGYLVANPSPVSLLTHIFTIHL